MIPHSKPTISRSDIEAVTKVLQSGMIAQGKMVVEFEKRFASYIGKKYAVACSSGTSAIHLALLGLGIGARDEVILPSYVCSSPYLACEYIGAIPRIADIDPLDDNISNESVNEQKTSKSKAIIVPHMFGTPAEIEEISEHGIPIVEDCAQSIGAEYENKKVGSLGEVSIFSFYATKMITTGEGGMLLTNNPDIYEKVKELRDYDMKPLTPPKYNYKMTDIQAALGISQLAQLETFIDKRREIASIYNDGLSMCELDLPIEFRHKKSVFYRFVIKITNLERHRNSLLKRGITSEKPVFLPLHRSISGHKCPHSDEAYACNLSIPLYPSLSKEEVSFVVRNLREVLETG